MNLTCLLTELVERIRKDAEAIEAGSKAYVLEDEIGIPYVWRELEEIRKCLVRSHTAANEPAELRCPLCGAAATLGQWANPVYSFDGTPSRSPIRLWGVSCENTADCGCELWGFWDAPAAQRAWLRRPARPAPGLA